MPYSINYKKKTANLVILRLAVRIKLNIITKHYINYMNYNIIQR